MTSPTHTKPGGTQRVVCELDPSMRAEERILDALAACEEHNAELYVVWVPGGGAVGLPTILRTAVDLATERGIRATSAVRFRNREVVLRKADSRRIDSPAPGIDARMSRPGRSRRSPAQTTSGAERRRT